MYHPAPQPLKAQRPFAVYGMVFSAVVLLGALFQPYTGSTLTRQADVKIYDVITSNATGDPKDAYLLIAGLIIGTTVIELLALTGNKVFGALGFLAGFGLAGYQYILTINATSLRIVTLVFKHGAWMVIAGAVSLGLWSLIFLFFRKKY